VFLQDAELPGRYKLAAELASRPGGEDLDLIVEQGLGLAAGGSDSPGGGGDKPGVGLAAQVGLALKDVQRFMRSLSQ
jgi:hypothetical protein